MSSTYANVRDAITARLGTVTNIGNVQSYRRAVTTYADLQAAYTATIGGVEQIRGWNIALESWVPYPDGWQSDGTMRMAGDAVFVVRGYMSANDADASDKTFTALVMSVMAALAVAANALDPRQSHVPLALRQNGYLNFEVPGLGTALVHHAEIALTLRMETVV